MVLSLSSPAAFAAASGVSIDPSKLPPPSNQKVEYDRDIKPIFEDHCYRCHGAERPKSSFSLTTRESALKGGDNGADILPGQSAKSPLIHYVARLVEDMEMPPPGKGEPLTPDQIALLRAWIDQGAAWSLQTNRPPPEVTVTTGVGWTGVSGNASQFREHSWQQEGWLGGLDHFRLKETTPNGTAITAEGRLIPNQNDYQVNLKFDKKDFGFAHFGYEEYRKYFQDSGGYYPPFGDVYKLDQDLHLNIGKAQAEFGLTLPHWPKIVFGYEYQFKEGDRSTLEWGPVGTTANQFDPRNNPKSIYPATQGVDERTHVLKLNVTHDIHGFFLEDDFRGEFYDQNDSRQNAVYARLGQPGPDKLNLVQDQYRHFQAANAFRLEKQLRDWLFFSAGYLYTHLDGDASFSLNTVLTPYAIPPLPGTRFDPFWFSQQILLSQQAHVFNVNTMWGPWQGLLFSAGVQNEWMSQNGFGRVRLDEGDPITQGPGFAQPATLDSNLDRFSVEEDFGLRYTKIPSTVLFAEARFQQESLGQFEEQNGGFHDFLDHLAATTDASELRAGFSISPWPSLALNAHYKRRYESDDYNYLTDITRVFGPPQPIATYPGFITARSLLTDSVETKLILKPATWLKTSLTYELVGTKYHTTTRSYSQNTPGDITPGGDLFAGDYKAHVYSANLTLIPWRRLYASTTFSYSDNSTSTPLSNQGGIVPYRGDVYSLLASVTYILTQATDLNAGYVFSRANYGQNNIANGLPLGISYDWHNMHAGLVHRLNRHMTTKLQYAFMSYHEPSSGGARDYTAHGIFASLSMTWPR